MKKGGVKAAQRPVRLRYQWTRAAMAMSAALTTLLCLFVLAIPNSSEGHSYDLAWISSTSKSPPENDVQAAPAAAQDDVRTVEIARGDTLTGILTDEGVPLEEAQAVSSALTPVFSPASLRGGQSITLTFDPQSAERPEPMLRSVSFKPSVERDVVVRRNDSGSFEAEEFVKELKPASARAQGQIQGSLYQSAKDAGVPDGVIVEMIRIYSHAVDFQREIRSGDTFDILYTKYVDAHGEALKTGAIDFVNLKLSGAARPLYRYASEEDQAVDYYSAEGASGRRLLMRTPIDGARLTSGYGMRMHPVLGYSKMHKGVDFSAPTGTPIMAAGNGVVRMASWFGTFGNYVKIGHTGNYETAYAHLSRFASGIREGARVRQGQIIGYVGTTGRSTGPHLHYEVMSNAAQLNPMDVKLPTGTTLAGTELEKFKAHVANVQSILDNWEKTPALVAQGEILRTKLLP